jgi:thymidylate synthase
MSFYGNITDEGTMRGFRVHHKANATEAANKNNSQPCILRTRVRKLEWMFHLALDVDNRPNDETYYWDAARFLISYGKGMAYEDVCQAWREAKKSVDRLNKMFPQLTCDYKSRASVQEWNQLLDGTFGETEARK